MDWTDEDIDRVKSGRVHRDDEILMKRFFAKSGKRTSYYGRSRKAALIRLRNYQRHTGDLGKKEAVFKAVSAKKTASGVRAIANYIARHKLPEEDRPEVFDEFGLPTRIEAIEDWKLLSDVENRKPDGIYHNVQARHLICSIKAESDMEKGQLYLMFERAIRGFVQDEFMGNGFQVLWCIHKDTLHHHAHLIVKSKPTRGPRLHFDKTGEKFDIFRNSLAEQLQKQGLDYVATRRADRETVRAQIFTGEKTLRAKNRKGSGRIAGPDILKLPRVTKEKAPRFSNLQLRKKQEMDVPVIFEKLYERPQEALKNWIWLIGHPDIKKERWKSHRFGMWVLINYPELCGPIKKNPIKPQTKKDVIEALKGVTLPDWPSFWQPRLKKRKKQVLQEVEQVLMSINRMFVHAFPDREERIIMMRREWKSLLYDVQTARRKHQQEQGPAKSRGVPERGL
jgi:MobA/VirD2-like, nuclease domain